MTGDGRPAVDTRPAPPDMAPMLPTALQVALGGAIGATLRWGLGLAFLRALGPTALPLPILVANILGSTVMGAVAASIARDGLSPYGPFVMTGLLGGFPTFSTFSLETLTLIERGQPALALLYVALSVGGALLGLWLGLALARGAL